MGIGYGIITNNSSYGIIPSISLRVKLAQDPACVFDRDSVPKQLRCLKDGFTTILCAHVTFHVLPNF